ncbi:MAG TPA: hypothetical protein VEI02_01695 [Planctomycetota bacterium]|nr:hypothetical protein [Planctomycetota bacterium]
MSSAVLLRRRGVRHGVFAPSAPASTARDAASRWDADRPVHLPGALTPWFTPALRRSVAACRRLFDGARRGGGLEAFVDRRLRGRADFRRGTTTVDLFDGREIEKVHVDALAGGRATARDLWAKLSWISVEEGDASLRLRFSFGSELLSEWSGDVARAEAADRFAEAVLPECAAVTPPPIRRLVARLTGGPARFSERIVYSNAPGGGAVFHHDAEPRQLGVLYGQLFGETGWLALPKRELAEALYVHGGRGAPRSVAAAMRALDDHDRPAADRLLNATPDFTRALVARGAFVGLRAGDALLLPSHGPDDCCWHAVFALGRTPSLAHSYGIFRARRG